MYTTLASTDLMIMFYILDNIRESLHDVVTENLGNLSPSEAILKRCGKPQ